MIWRWPNFRNTRLKPLVLTTSTSHALISTDFRRYALGIASAMPCSTSLARCATARQKWDLLSLLRPAFGHQCPDELPMSFVEPAFIQEARDVWLCDPRACSRTEVEPCVFPTLELGIKGPTCRWHLLRNCLNSFTSLAKICCGASVLKLKALCQTDQI